MLIEQLLDAQTILGEGPLWDIEEQRLYWIDSLGCSLHRSDARGRGQETWALPSEIGSMTLRRAGGAVLALRTGLHTFEFASGRCELIADPEVHQPLTRLNDGKVDRQGRFVFGSMDMGEAAPEAGEETTAVRAVELVHEATPTSADASTHTHRRVDLVFTTAPARPLRAPLPGSDPCRLQSRVAEN